MPKCEFLTRCATRFEGSTQGFEALVAGMSEEQANWRPAPGRWSVAQCIEHLNVSASTYFERMEPAIRRGGQRGLTGSAPYGRGTLVGRLLLGVLDPNRPRRTKAPKAFRPAQDQLRLRRVCKDFRAVQARFGELIERADGLDLGRIVFATPISRLFRVTAAQAFEIHARHEERHLAQAEAVTRKSGFPTSGR